MKFKSYIEETITLDEAIDKYLFESQSHSDHEADKQYWKDITNKIAKSIEDEEFRFKKKYVKSDPNRVDTKFASNAQKLAMIYLFSNPSVDEIVKTFKISWMEAGALLDHLNKNFYWFKDSKLWQ